MKLIGTRSVQGRHSARVQRRRRGSALLMAFLMLIVLYAIIFQLWYTTSADLRVTQNDVATTQMDLAVESALQEVFDRLRTDGEAAAGDSGAGAGAAAAAAGADGGGAEGGGESEGPTDSREDAWGKPQRTSIGDIELRILVQDEDSKINILTMLAEDETEAEEAFERIVRVIDMFRDGSTADLDRGEALRIAEAMKRHLLERANSVLPKPKLLTDDEEQQDRGMPLSLKEFEALPRVDESLFRDFRDERGDIVHSLGAYLTVWSSPARGAVDQAGGASGAASGAGGGASGGTDGGGAGGSSGDGSGGSSDGASGGQDGSGGAAGGGSAGGGAAGGGAGGASGSGATPNWGMVVNINTAPVAVLKSLLDDRDVPSRLWDSVLEYRNMPEREEQDSSSSTPTEPTVDEFGEEVIKRQIFDSLDELSEIDGYERLEQKTRDRMASLLTVQSQVFSIYVTARRKTGTEEDFGGVLGARRAEEREDVRGKGLVRTVRCVVWRYNDGEETRIIPIVRWEVLDYTPFEVQDFPDENR